MNYIQLIIISLAVASISFTISRSIIFRPIRLFICNRSKFLGELISCIYCLSHWISFIFMIYFYRFTLNFIIMSFACITLANIWAGFINHALDFFVPND